MHRRGAPSGSQLGGGTDFCDTKPLAWSMAACPTCVDADGDQRFVGCDTFGANGSDACDDDPLAWTSGACATCADGDSDGYYVGCDSLPNGSADACDGDPYNHSPVACSACADLDGDGYFSDCNVYGGARPGPDCDDNDDFVHPGMPGDRYGQDTNCDGTQLSLSDTAGVFVAPPGNGGSDGQPGTQAMPKATIGAALTVAAAQGKVVFVMQGTYAEAPAITRSIYGGFKTDWLQHNPGAFATIVTGGAAATAGTVSGQSLVVAGITFKPATTAGPTTCTGLAIGGAAANTVYLDTVTATGSECPTGRIGLSVSGVKLYGTAIAARGRLSTETASQSKNAYGIKASGTTLKIKGSIVSGSEAIAQDDATNEWNIEAFGLDMATGSTLALRSSTVTGGFGENNTGVLIRSGGASIEASTIVGTTTNPSATVGAVISNSVAIEHQGSGALSVYRSKLVSTRKCRASGYHQSLGIYSHSYGTLDVVNSMVDAGDCGLTRGIHATPAGSARTRVINSNIVGPASGTDHKLLILETAPQIVVNSILLFTSVVNTADTANLYLGAPGSAGSSILGAAIRNNLIWYIGAQAPTELVRAKSGTVTTNYTSIAVFNSASADYGSNVGVVPGLSPSALRDLADPPSITAASACYNAGVDPATVPVAPSQASDRYALPIRDLEENALRPQGTWDIGVDEIP
ncbi:MAG: putative metal-binding motif-containing protein [Deltaproteobacteria bacterium]|nr:putative metal-binding motif-containing protein [Deltaproteobacteria bacterium]